MRGLGLLIPFALFGVGYCRQVEVEDVTGRQFEAAAETEDILAVYWYSKNCKTCDRVLSILERIGEDVADAGVTLIRVNDKKSAKVHGVRNFPALSLIRSGDISQFEGDLTDQDSILDFLTNLGATEEAGKVQQVTASELELLVTQNQFVAVFFFSGSKGTAGIEALTNLINLAEPLDIRVVCINDLALVAEYSLGELPALVYYRHTIPILYQGDIDEEGDILEWLVQNRHSGEEGDQIEEVDINSLEAMISAVENIAVLFYDSKSRRTDQILENLEKIDDDCDTRGVHFVKISSTGGKFGVSSTPTLVFFKNKAPQFYSGNLMDEEEVLQWILAYVESAEIEEMSSSLLGKIIRETKHVVVVFCKYIAYAIIALTHTCYLIKNYSPDNLKHFLPPQNVRGMAYET